MTKSLDNCIYISDSSEELKRKVMNMYTDPKRIHPTDPGTVEGNPVFTYHDAFNPNKEEVKDLKNRYREGKVGDIEVKEKLYKALNNLLEPVRDERKKYESDLSLVSEIIKTGVKKVREEAKKTLEEVKGAMRLNY